MRFLLVFLLLISTAFANDRVDKGKKLTQDLLYDEALEVLKDIDIETCGSKVDLLFYRSCCNFYLLNREEALIDLKRLLDFEDEAPKRFIFTAKRMIFELDIMEPDSLGEIGQLMTDSARRLEKGQANKRLQDEQQLIIDKLDKLIEKLEEQQQQQQQQQMAQSSGGSQKRQKSNSTTPASDSKITDDKGAGNVDKKNNFDDKSWGNLPPEERKEALQGIVRDLPWHYREAIEAYFRKMAIEG